MPQQDLAGAGAATRQLHGAQVPGQEHMLHRLFLVGESAHDDLVRKHDAPASGYRVPRDARRRAVNMGVRDNVFQSISQRLRVPHHHPKRPIERGTGLADSQPHAEVET